MATVPGTLAVGAPPSSLRLAHFPDETYRMARLTFRYSGIRTRRIFPLEISRTLPPRSENFVPFPASGGIQITEAGEIQQSQLGVPLRMILGGE
ncbi:hypothetical protein SAY87_008104 [Trapa incisa]|uniref:Uncharacterized protein n=1 Tax=Trapa incisa TaxID=236973 RepID=A0AAN7KP88_9MYRT|nr:hypothetical protein SAY87_008104 [Trapa incisa]